MSSELDPWDLGTEALGGKWRLPVVRVSRLMLATNSKCGATCRLKLCQSSLTMGLWAGCSNAGYLAGDTLVSNLGAGTPIMGAI